MLLSNLAAIAAATSGLTATASLIYLAIQTRQSVLHTRAQIHQGVAARATSALLRMMDPDVVAAWIEGNGGTPTPELIRRRQFHYHCGAIMIGIEDYFSQHEQGMLGDEQFARGAASFRQLLQEPGLRAYWLTHREVVAGAAPGYGAFIDSLCAGPTATFGDWAP